MNSSVVKLSPGLKHNVKSRVAVGSNENLDVFSYMKQGEGKYVIGEDDGMDEGFYDQNGEE